MTRVFTSQWQKRLRTFTYTSILPLENIPTDLNEDTIVEYISENKRAQQIGSHPLLWLILIWIQLLGFTLAGLFCLYQVVTFLVVAIHPLLQSGWNIVVDWELAPFFPLLGSMLTLVVFAIFNKSKLHLWLIYFLGGFTLLSILPIVPLLKFRQLQKQLADNYWISLKWVTWRETPLYFSQNVKPLGYFDVFLYNRYKSKYEQYEKDRKQSWNRKKMRAVTIIRN